MSGSVHAVEGPQPPTLSLDECVRQVLEKSPAMASALVDLQEKDAAFRSAKKDLYPTLSFQYGYANQPDDPFAENLYRYSIILDQPLYRGKALVTAKEISRLDTFFSDYGFRQLKNDLIFQTHQAYFDLLRTLKLEEVAQQALQSLAAQVKDAQAFYDSGLIPKNDLLQSEVELAQGQQDLLVAQNNTEISKSNLNILMQKPLDESLVIKDILKYEQREVLWSEILALAKAERPEIRQGELLVRQAEHSIQLAKAPFLPSVSLNAAYTKQGDDPLAEDLPSPFAFELLPNETKTIQATAQWKFWSWGKSRNEVFVARSQLAKTKEALAQVIDTITLELRQAFLQLKQAGKNIYVSEKAIELAQENYRISKARYQAQLNTSTEVLDAQTVLSRAQSNYYNTLYVYNIALVALDRATGVLEKKY